MIEKSIDLSYLPINFHCLLTMFKHFIVLDLGMCDDRSYKNKTFKKIQTTNWTLNIIKKLIENAL